MIVARGIVRSGSLTSSAGTVADSRPMNAHSVSAAVVDSRLQAGAVRRERLVVAAVDEEDADEADHGQRDELQDRS